MDDLPMNYDAIVVGTGMTESVIAAALSRIGKSVLHLDSNDYYGENWASFNLDGFENWSKTNSKIENPKTLNGSFNYSLEEGEKLIEIKDNVNVFNIHLNNFCTNVKISPKVSAKVMEDTELQEAEKSIRFEENLKKISRKFNLDLCPKLLFSKGTLVQLLISSNIARYAEFKSVSRVLTWREGQLEPVPCSRADVFATKNVSVVHKRILVKILTLFANYTENLEEFKAFENKTFLEYLKHKKLPENLIHYILYAIALGDNATLCLDGVKNCKAFLESLGKYGNTPFIFPMYGSGELPQCFCRLCAVYGGIYCLQRGIEALIVKNNQCVGVISNKKRLNTKVLILSSKYIPECYSVNEECESTSRGVFITDRSIYKTDKESLTLLQFPPVPQVSDNTVTVIELGSGSCTCPENYFLVHMTAKATKDASSDLKHVAQALFKNEHDSEDLKPNILWSGTWNVSTKTSKASDFCVKNIKICRGVDSELDYNFSISEAKKIFMELYPGEEFLPRAPEPDEIALEVEGTSSNDENPYEKKTNDYQETIEIVSKEDFNTEKEKIESDVSEGEREKYACDMDTSEDVQYSIS